MLEVNGINNNIKLLSQYCNNFKNANYEIIKDSLQEKLQIDLSNNLETYDLETKCAKFYSCINLIIEKHVPKIPIYKSNFPKDV